MFEGFFCIKYDYDLKTNPNEDVSQVANVLESELKIQRAPFNKVAYSKLTTYLKLVQYLASTDSILQTQCRQCCFSVEISLHINNRPLY